MKTELIALLKQQEGIELKPYRDTVGKLTIGIGRNLDDVGISEDEAMYLLKNDIDKVELLASRNFAWFDALDDVRKVAILSMVFNLGLRGFAAFTNTIGLIELKNYDAASREMLNSTWAKQVGHRAVQLSNMLRTGMYSS